MIECENCHRPIFQTELGGWHHGPEGSSLVRIFCATGHHDWRTATPSNRQGTPT